MARLHQVKVRRVGKRGEYTLRCAACQGEIGYGEPYKWFKRKAARGGVKMSYHPACPIPPSHKTTSRMGLIFDAQLLLYFPACGSVEECQAMLQDFAGIVREVAEEYRESVSSMEEGFGHRTSQADELEERAEALEDWAESLEDWEPEDDEPERDDYPEGDDGDDEHEEDVAHWLDDQRDAAASLADECPV
jgi:hypothetical protein